MVVLHSFTNLSDTLWKELAYSKFLSCVLAKKHYGDIRLYTSTNIAKQVKDMGMPYSAIDITLLSRNDSSTWSIPKIKVFSSFTEPFLHIDNDTFFFNKVDFDSLNKPFLFSHPDQNVKKLKGSFNQITNSIIRNLLPESNPEPGSMEDLVSMLNNIYIRLFLKLSDTIPSSILSSFDFASIPNMNITYVKDFKNFNQASKLALSHYAENKEEIDAEVYGPCYIEQLYIHQALRDLSSEYKELSDNNKHVLFNGVPFQNIDKFNDTAKLEDTTFPIRGKLKFQCQECSHFHSEKFSFDESELREFLDYDFRGFLHSSYLKWYDIYQAYIIHQLRNEIGDEGLRRVYSHFVPLYSKLGIPTKSGGEKLYEKLTNFSFEKVGNSKNLSYI